MPDVISPVAIEEAIRTVADRIANGVKVCDERYRAFLDAERAHDQAFAAAYLGADGPAHEKKYRAELATSTTRAARDTADAAYRYADRQARALNEQLRALQSVGASMRLMYATAGTGER